MPAAAPSGYRNQFLLPLRNLELLFVVALIRFVPISGACIPHDRTRQNDHFDPGCKAPHHTALQATIPVSHGWRLHRSPLCLTGCGFRLGMCTLRAKDQQDLYELDVLCPTPGELLRLITGAASHVERFRELVLLLALRNPEREGSRMCQR